MKKSIVTTVLSSFLVVSLVAAATNDDENWTISGYIADSGLTTINLSATGVSSLTSSDVLTLSSGGSATWGTTAGNLTLDAVGALNLGTINTTGVTITTDGTGDGELTVPAGSISGTEITDATILVADLNTTGTLTDEFCLTYESTGGIFEWQSCGGAAANSFETHSTPAGTSPVASSSTDTLTWSNGTGITITGDSGSDTITIAVNEGGLTLSNLGGSLNLATQVTGILGDANVSDTLTIGVSSTVADGALSSNVSLFGASVDSSEITDGTIVFGDMAQNGCTTDEIIQWNGAAWVCAEPSVRLNNILAADGVNTIGNAAFEQRWNWSLTGATNGMTFGESSASTGTGSILAIDTLAGSTASPFTITHDGVDKLYVNETGSTLYLNANGSTTDPSQLLFPGTAGTGDFRIGADGGDIFWQGGGGRVLQMGSYWPTVLSGNAQTSSFPAFVNGGGVYSARNTIVINPTGRTGDATLVLRPIGSQTGNLTQWENSSGTVLSSVNSSGHLTIGQSGTAITRHLSTTGSINFGNLDGNCDDQTITVTGASVGDSVVATPTPTTNGIEDGGNTYWNAYVSATNTVTIRGCDGDAQGGAFNPSAQTWRVDVWQH